VPGYARIVGKGGNRLQSLPRTVEGQQLASVRATFAYRECAQALFATGQELFLHSLDHVTMPLERLIGARSWERLRCLASLCHVSRRQLDQGRAGHDLERLLSEALTRPLVVFDLLHRLEREAQELFLFVSAGRKWTHPGGVQHLRIQTGAPAHVVFPVRELYAGL